MNSVEYVLGNIKRAMDAIEKQERVIYDMKCVLMDVASELLATYCEPIFRIAGIPEVVRVSIRKQTMYDSPSVYIQIKLIVRSIDNEDMNHRLARYERAENLARRFLHDRYAGGIANYVHINTEEE